MQDLLAAFEDRRLKMGKTMYRELIGLKKPIIDKSKILYWPVLLLYPEVMSSDIIEEFCETDMFSSHLDTISFVSFLSVILYLSSFLFLFILIHVNI